jgi:ribosomal protein S27AE
MTKRPTKEQIDFIRASDLEPRLLKKATGLSLSVIKRLKGIKTAKRINPRSKRLTEGMKLYKVARDEFLRDNPRCQICGNEQMLSIHHIAGRSGRNLCDKENFLVACLGGSYHLSDLHVSSNRRDGCHPWIEANLKLARELGYSKSKRYESNTNNKD